MADDIPRGAKRQSVQLPCLSDPMIPRDFVFAAPSWSYLDRPVGALFSDTLPKTVTVAGKKLQLAIQVGLLNGNRLKTEMARFPKKIQKPQVQ